MLFHRITRSVTLVFFAGLMLIAVYPYCDGLGVDFFLRLDPLIGMGTMIAARTFLVYLLPGILVLVATLVFGRFFCGHVCPMGSTLDMLEIPLLGHRRRSVKGSTYEASSRYRSWKYLALAMILAAAIGGVSLVHLGSPLSLVTRFYGLCLYPILTLTGESVLSWLSGWFSAAGLHHMALLQVREVVFGTNAFVACLFVGIICLGYFQPRFWCRNLCPAGALMGLFGRSPIVKRRVSDACTKCGRCIRVCPTGAIHEDPALTAYAECVVCLRCPDVCPEGAISFGVQREAGKASGPSYDPTRRQMCLSIGSGLMASSLLHTGINQPRPLGKDKALVAEDLIRPPGALPEAEFLTRCVRCGECMKACPTNTLQPIWLKAGLEGLFTPVMTPRLGACAIECNACGGVCPTGAIRALSLPEKRHAKVGTAWIVRQNCLVWEQDKKCLVCDEACPYNAISFQPVEGLLNGAPFVIENRCTGCGWCETKCPVEGASAIRVNVIGEIRLASGSYEEKAKEYGLIFKAKDNATDRLAPGTFDGSKLPGESAAPEKPATFPPALPEGFDVK